MALRKRMAKRGYVSKMILWRGSAMQTAQRVVSRRMSELLRGSDKRAVHLQNRYSPYDRRQSVQREVQQLNNWRPSRARRAPISAGDFFFMFRGQPLVPPAEARRRPRCGATPSQPMAARAPDLPLWHATARGTL